MISLTYSTYEFCQIIMTLGSGRGHCESRGGNLQRITTLELKMDPKGHLIKPPIGCQIPFYCGPDKWPSEFIWQQGHTS